MNRVFVYGSLKKDYGNHSYVEKSEFIGKAKTLPIFTMISYGFFPACLINGKTEISGEVYDVTDSILSRMDRLEGVPNHYQRIRCITTLGEAWIYVMKDDVLRNAKNIPIIETGFWQPPLR